MQMEIEGWLITLLIICLTAAANYIAFKTGIGKDVGSLIIRANKHSDRMGGIEKEIGDCVKKGDCIEDMRKYEKSQDEIKATVIRLEQKFDKYILNGRGS